jgi:hypothetical protein
MISGLIGRAGFGACSMKGTLEKELRYILHKCCLPAVPMAFAGLVYFLYCMSQNCQRWVLFDKWGETCVSLLDGLRIDVAPAQGINLCGVKGFGMRIFDLLNFAA